MYCECGCGELAPIATKTSAHYGWVKGQPKRFINGHNGRGTKRPEIGRKIAASLRGKPSGMLGRRHSDESRRLMSERRTGKPNPLIQGERHPLWNGGHCKARKLRPRAAGIRPWARQVKERDGYTCQHCGANQRRYLHAHHIKSWSEHPELRFDVSNGITLCQPCHRAVHATPPSAFAATSGSPPPVLDLGRT